MKRLLASLLLGTVLSLVAISRDVRGQAPGQAANPTGTPAPSATPVPTSTLPAAQDLVARANAANRRKGSVHFTASYILEQPKLARITQSVVGDLLYRGIRARERVTQRTTQLNQTPQATQVQHIQIVLVGQTGAMRTDGKKWQCQNVQGLQQTLQGMANQLVGPGQTTMATLGSESAAGVAVWHVQIKQNVPLSTEPMTEDIYISQADDTVQRLSISGSLTVQGQTLQERLSEKFSRYGEKIQIKLPKACRGAGA